MFIVITLTNSLIYFAKISREFISNLFLFLIKKKKEMKYQHTLHFLMTSRQ